MPKLFIAGIALFLLLGAGYAITQAARSIPWDCDDWQAFAHDDRTIAILESLAENRGKTLYCGIDQSDTFGKAETWAAGKDRNERDDTVYWGERGSFRGFIAAQEGWLTEGESGITGQSIATIFEFPKEEKRRVKRTKRIKLAATPDRPISGPVGPEVDIAPPTNETYAQTLARSQFNSSKPAGWDAWPTLVQAAARAECRRRGYPRAVNAAIVPIYYDSSGNVVDGVTAITYSHLGTAGWAYTANARTDGGYKWRAYLIREYTATCEKKVRRTRR